MASQKPNVMQALNVRWSLQGFRSEINTAQLVLRNFGVVYSRVIFCYCIPLVSQPHAIGEFLID